MRVESLELKEEEKDNAEMQRTRSKRREEVARGQNRKRHPSGRLFLLTFNFKLSTVNYFREKRSKSAICEAISSRAESPAERMPWMRSLNSSAFEARARASSSVTSCFE